MADETAKKRRKRRRTSQVEGAAGRKRLDRKSGGITAAARRHAEKEGDTMPGGRFPIRNRHDLENAKHDVGRAKGDKAAVRRWIDKRAKELGAPPLGGSEDKKD